MDTSTNIEIRNIGRVRPAPGQANEPWSPREPWRREDAPAPAPPPPPTLDLSAIADMLASRVVEQQQQALQPKLDTRTFREAMNAVLDCIVERSTKSDNYKVVSRHAIRHACDAIGDVRICDLSAEHVPVLWEALRGKRRDGSPGKSLPSYSRALAPRIVDAEERCGFVGMARFRAMLPDLPQTARVNIEVSDTIHREALAAVRWAAENTDTDSQVLDLLDLSLRVPSRINELCSLTWPSVALGADVPRLRLVDSKTGPGDVVLTRGAVAILQRQRERLQWDQLQGYVWPSDSARGHILPRTVSQAWRRIRAAYAEHRRTPEAAAVARWRLHDLRGGLATQASDHGASVRHIQRAFRHKDPRTTERYVHGGSLHGPAAVIQMVEDVLEAKSHDTRAE